MEFLNILEIILKVEWITTIKQDFIYFNYKNRKIKLLDFEKYKNL